MGSLTLRPALLLFGNSRPRVTATPLPHATEAHGQLPGRDFNPLDLLLLLRTVSFDLIFSLILSIFKIRIESWPPPKYQSNLKKQIDADPYTP
jgi:hypothetical protein